MNFPFLTQALSGETSDVYFHRTRQILEKEGIDPYVGIRIFCRKGGILCGVEEVIDFLTRVNFHGRFYSEKEGFEIKPGHSATMLIYCKYSEFCIYETAILGILAFGTGKATAAKELVDATKHIKYIIDGRSSYPTSINSTIPIYSFGARHNHPNVAAQLDYAAQVGGCSGASTAAGARLFGRKPVGSFPHAYCLILGDTVKAAQLFDKHIEPKVPRIFLVDTFKDEVEESIRVLNEVKGGIRLDTSSERGGVKPELVAELKAKLKHAGLKSTIMVSGGIIPERISKFNNDESRPDSFGVGEYISNAPNISFTADLFEVDGKSVNKRGRAYYPPELTMEPSYEN